MKPKAPTLKEILKSYNELGFYLFPASKLTHKPMFMDNLNLAENNLERLESWFSTSYKDANIGLSCAKSGVVVVDVDVKNGGLDFWMGLVAQYGDPKTLRARTPSGGLHYVFKARKGVSYVGKITDGVDIKFNGYVLLFPSISKKNGQMYLWENNEAIAEAPVWLADMIEKKIGEKKSSTFSKNFSNKYLSSLVNELRKFELSYHDWMRAGMAIHSAMPNEEGLALWIEASKGPSYKDGDEQKCCEKWAGFKADEDGGVRIETLAFIIRQKGGKVPNPYLQEDLEEFKNQLINDGRNEKQIYMEQDEEFVEDDDGNRRVSWHETRCVEGVNKMGHLFMLDNRNCIGRITDGEEGGKTIVLKPTNLFLEQMAPYVYRYIKPTATGEKLEEKNAGAVWLRSARRNECKGIIFAEHDRPGYFNNYTPLNNERLEGNPSLYLDFIFNSLCNKQNEKFEWLLDWSAHIFQKPFQKGATVPVHATKQGRGKGLYYDAIMKSLLGRYMVTIQSADEVTSKFNLHLANRFLTFLDEASWRGNRAEDGVLKKLIGSPKISVEEKFGARYEVNNFSRYAFGSNNEEVVALELGNRRYVMIEAFDGELSNNTDYFNPIWDAFREGSETKRFYNFLMERDLTDFNPFKIIGDNTDGLRSKLASNGAVAAFWYDNLFESPLPVWNSKGLMCETTYNYFCDWVQKVKHYDRGITQHLFWAHTKKLVPTLPSSVQGRQGNGRVYHKFISPSSFAESFCKSLQLAVPKNFDAALLSNGGEFDDIKNNDDDIDW